LPLALGVPTVAPLAAGVPLPALPAGGVKGGSPLLEMVVVMGPFSLCFVALYVSDRRLAEKL
jgi:hypothetical protein